MRTERFTDFGEPPRYLETLQNLAFNFVVFLLVSGLAFSNTLVISHFNLTGQTRTAFQDGTRHVLLFALGPPRVGLQIGHDGADRQPSELAHLRGNTGGFADGLSELAVNRSVALALKRRLEAHGVTVDLLRATPPAGYHADLMLALHADSVSDTTRTGYKSAYFHPPRSGLEPGLKGLIDADYLRATGLPDDTENTTDAMREYYAFNFRSYAHTIHPATPALIVELGYLSNPSDATLLREPDVLAGALAGGVVRFLEGRNRLP